MWGFWTKITIKKQKKTDKVYQSFSFIMCENTNSDTNKQFYRSEYTKSDTKFMTCETRNI